MTARRSERFHVTMATAGHPTPCTAGGRVRRRPATSSSWVGRWGKPRAHITLADEETETMLTTGPEKM